MNLWAGGKTQEDKVVSEVCVFFVGCIHYSGRHGNERCY
jgi:hypothetical protein